jgi:hypothetical protein
MRIGMESGACCHGRCALSFPGKPMRPETLGRNINWKVHALLFIPGDLNMLRQVFIKLLSNAISPGVGATFYFRIPNHNPN